MTSPFETIWTAKPDITGWWVLVPPISVPTMVAHAAMPAPAIGTFIHIAAPTMKATVVMPAPYAGPHRLQVSAPTMIAQTAMPAPAIHGILSITAPTMTVTAAMPAPSYAGPHRLQVSAPSMAISVVFGGSTYGLALPFVLPASFTTVIPQPPALPFVLPVTLHPSTAPTLREY